MAHHQFDEAKTNSKFARTNVQSAVEQAVARRGQGTLAAELHQPREVEIADLIARATEHPLGLDFLTNGALDAVSAVFSVHAFVIEHARASIRKNGRANPVDISLIANVAPRLNVSPSAE